MKKSLLLIILGFIILNTHAQKKPGTYWSTIGGLKAGVNNSNIRFGSGTPIASTSDAWNYGFTGGFWTALPLSTKVSFQPELMYSQMGGNATFPGSLSQYNSTISHYNLTSGYLSIPLLLKLHLGKVLAIYAGPQFGLLLNGKADVTRNNIKTNVDLKDSLGTTDVAFAGGIQLFPRGKVHLDFRYIYGVNNFWTSKTGNYFNQAFQATVGLRLFGKKYTVKPPDSDGDGILDKDDKCPAVPGVKEYQGCPIPDTDGDGITDDKDKCPNVKGLAKYNGCPIPDTDKDGINDEEDKCPAVFGLIRYKGCPIPDTDGDGVNDEEDKCPTVPGVIEYKGCPIPDRDKDGILDDQDECPDVPGVASKHGCPDLMEEFKFNYRVIQFPTGSAKLTTKDQTELNKVVEAMNKYSNLKLNIDGHSDITGNAKSNLKLSQNRAGSVKGYLVMKGIAADRLIATGYGQDRPIADNKTVAGRTANRRVEFIVNQKP